MKEGADKSLHQVGTGEAAVSSPPTESREKKAERGSKAGLGWDGELGPLCARRVFSWMPSARDLPFGQSEGEDVKAGLGYGGVGTSHGLPMSEN